MSAAGVTSCPACHGLMGPGAQQRASMSPQARREVIDRAYDAVQSGRTNREKGRKHR